MRELQKTFKNTLALVGDLLGEADLQIYLRMTVMATKPIRDFHNFRITHIKNGTTAASIAAYQAAGGYGDVLRYVAETTASREVADRLAISNYCVDPLELGRNFDCVKNTFYQSQGGIPRTDY